jgi:hypothetical protein
MSVELKVEKDDSVLHLTIANCLTVSLLQKSIHSRNFCVKVTKIPGVIPHTVWLSYKSLKESTKLVWAPHTFRVVLFNPQNGTELKWVEKELFSKSQLYLWFSLKLIFSKNFCILFFLMLTYRHKAAENLVIWPKTGYFGYFDEERYLLAAIQNPIRNFLVILR